MSAKVVLKSTCWRLETPESFSNVENISMKLKPTLEIIKARWLFVNRNSLRPHFSLYCDTPLKFKPQTRTQARF